MLLTLKIFVGLMIALMSVMATLMFIYLYHYIQFIRGKMPWEKLRKISLFIALAFCLLIGVVFIAYNLAQYGGG